MIVLGKDKTLDNYFIDENGVITDQFGNIQELKFYGGERPCFKGVPIHRIMMYTFYGYRNGKQWAIHHLDENKLNNSLNNLVYLTRLEHIKLHKKGNKNKFYGKHHTEETKRKISETLTGQFWFNDGVKNYRCKECPPGCVKGRI